MHIYIGIFIEIFVDVICFLYIFTWGGLAKYLLGGSTSKQIFSPFTVRDYLYMIYAYKCNNSGFISSLSLCIAIILFDLYEYLVYLQVFV